MEFISCCPTLRIPPPPTMTMITRWLNINLANCPIGCTGSQEKAGNVRVTFCEELSQSKYLVLHNEDCNERELDL